MTHTLSPLAVALPFVLAGGCASGPGGQRPDPPFALSFTDADVQAAQALEPMLERGMRVVEEFFGQPFRRRVAVGVFPNRAAFTASFPAEWGLSQTQSWMVASGVAGDLRILSPRVWRTEASGHDPDDAFSGFNRNGQHQSRLFRRFSDEGLPG